MEYRFYLTNKSNILIRDKVGQPIERYDKKLKRWVVDYDMSGIYSGDILAESITKEKADYLITR